MAETRQPTPAARKSDLVIQEADGETLIYDLKSHKAHCLNHTAAVVWKQCDGKRTIEEVAQRAEAELSEPIPLEVVLLAIEQLEKSRLLQEAVIRESGERHMSRRQVMLRIGISAAAAFPFIKTINAPAAIQAASCAGVEEPCGGANPICCPPFQCSADGSCFDPR